MKKDGCLLCRINGSLTHLCVSAPSQRKHRRTSSQFNSFIGRYQQAGSNDIVWRGTCSNQPLGSNVNSLVINVVCSKLRLPIQFLNAIVRVHYLVNPISRDLHRVFRCECSVYGWDSISQTLIYACSVLYVSFSAPSQCRSECATKGWVL